MEAIYEKVEAKYLSVKECAKYLNIGINKMYKLCRKDDFPAFQIGSKTFVDKDDLDKYIRNTPNWASGATSQHIDYLILRINMETIKKYEEEFTCTIDFEFNSRRNEILFKLFDERYNGNRMVCYDIRELPKTDVICKKLMRVAYE